MDSLGFSFSRQYILSQFNTQHVVTIRGNESKTTFAPLFVLLQWFLFGKNMFVLTAASEKSFPQQKVGDLEKLSWELPHAATIPHWIRRESTALI